MTEYFGTRDSLPALLSLRAGQLSCSYELGALRYVYVGEEEVLRRVYAAVRDEQWNTLPFSIENEAIHSEENGFSIRYTAIFNRGEESVYKAQVGIRGDEKGEIIFTFEGVGLGDFLRNRIGICVLHPIKNCTGQPVWITSDEGDTQQLQFPELISPHQPFLKIREMRWLSAAGTEARLAFEGDVFETEDQRNWTDHSFKTYSTPLYLPKPVAARTGDTVSQKVTFHLLTAAERTDTPPAEFQTLLVTGEKINFPRLGYMKSPYGLTDQLVEKLGKVPMDHLRVLVDLESLSWEENFREAVSQARSLQTKLELVVVLGDHPWQEVVNLVGALTGETNGIRSLSLVNTPRAVSEDGFLSVVEVLRKYLPGMKIGYATDGNFAELNRVRPVFPNQYDFVAFSLNPQVHATDPRTIIENISAQAYIIQTIRSFLGPSGRIHVSPLTFRARNHPDSYDPRLHTEFAAAYMLLSIRHLAGAEKLTLFETHGPLGLLPESGPHPVYDYLKLLREFEPVRILLTHSPEPFRWDALVVENDAGEQLYFLINFQEAPVQVQWTPGRRATLPAGQITHFREARP